MIGRASATRVVQFTEWFQHNQDHLRSIWAMIQEYNDRTGRRVFDRETCSFPDWCRVAYSHSALYTRDRSWMYADDSDDNLDPD